VSDEILGRIFGPVGEEVSEKWGTFRRKEPHNLCYSPNIVRVN
jgi:hypothetical protein